MKEIGSEFWSVPTKQIETRFFISGRTALDYIVRDIRRTTEMNAVLLPSWCCHTMIEPFVRNGMSIRFYDVRIDSNGNLSVEIPKPIDNEIFYYMTYFGFSNLAGLDYQYIRRNWKRVIADETHSWLSKKCYDNIVDVPDYIYVSYRKWMGVYGIATAEKRVGSFAECVVGKVADEYNDIRREASKMKEAYISGVSTEKTHFLDLYNRAEQMLEEDYVDYLPSIESVQQLINADQQYIKNKRRRNAEVLIQLLSKIPEISLIFDSIHENEVPLFVPIVVEQGTRDSLRQFLIENSVFCPVHWTFSHFHEGISDQAKRIYNQELSIMCDQRYGIEDMERIVELILCFFDRRDTQCIQNI